MIIRFRELKQEGSTKGIKAKVIHSSYILQFLILLLYFFKFFFEKIVYDQ